MERVALAAALIITAFAACSEDTAPQREFDDEDPTVLMQTSATGMQTSAGTGGASSTMTTATGAMGGGTSTSTGTPCTDPGPEPNENEGSASYLGAIDDCDASQLTFSGVLDGNDVDWYYYDGSDVLGCSVDAFRSITADGQTRICKYTDCPGVTFTCPVDSTPDTSPNGRAGCCASNSLMYSPDCNGFSDDSTVYIRVDKPSGFSCVSYSVTVHY